MIHVYRHGVTPELNAFSRQARLVKNEPGSLSFEVLLDEADGLGDVAERVDVTVEDDVGGTTTALMFGRLGPTDVERVASGEESAQVVHVSIPGALSLLADAVVFPRSSAGAYVIDSDTRFFNFASPEYDDSAWTPAAEIVRWRDNDGFPRNWPDPSAYLIWGVLEGRPLGANYFRRTATYNAGPHVIYITADDTWVLYVDGEEVGRGDKYFGLADTNEVAVQLTEGDHVIGVYATNQYVGGAHIIVAVYEKNYYVDVLVVHTDSDWNCLAYPATPPGLTPGRIVGILMDEALARGGLTVAADPWTRSFDDDDDSNLDPWTQEIEFAVRVGASLLDVVRSICETWTDVSVDGTDPILELVNKGGGNTLPGVFLYEGLNLASLTVSGDVPARTAVLVRGANGAYTEIDSSIDGDRRESFLDAGTAPSQTSAGQIGVGALIATSPSTVQIVAAVEAFIEAVPFVDFHVGDVINAPNRNGVQTATEVTSISAIDIPESDDGGGYTGYIVEGVQGGLQTASTGIVNVAPTADVAVGGNNGAANSPVLFNLDF